MCRWMSRKCPEWDFLVHKKMNRHVHRYIIASSYLRSQPICRSAQCWNSQKCWNDWIIIVHPSHTQTFFTPWTICSNIKRMFMEDSYAVFNVCKHLWTLNNHDKRLCSGWIFDVEATSLDWWQYHPNIQIWIKMNPICSR